MSAPAIAVKGLGKRYTLGARSASLRDTFDGLLRWRRRDHAPPQPFWALREVDLEAARGEILGVIGPNGSGKSTFLKILSGVTDPTEGRAEIRGRVASLLEVGTGFHPELTGRDNIYLSGAILGMRRAEIARKFDDIVAFAGVEKFIDTPVKHYSSGMYVRLGFAVAAHLDADVLLIDEVLAVGDAEFQRRCLGRMHHVMKDEGRTILFVSHNLQAIATLCTRAVLLQAGKTVMTGPAPEVVAKYLAGATQNTSGEVVWTGEAAPGTDVVKLRAVRTIDVKGQVRARFEVGEPFSIELDYSCGRAGTQLTPAIHLYTEGGVLLLATANLHEPGGDRPLDPGLYRSTCQIPAEFLNKGVYYLTFFLSRDISHVEVHEREIAAIEVMDVGGGEGRGGYSGEWIGLLRCKLPWSTRQVLP